MTDFKRMRNLTVVCLTCVAMAAGIVLLPGCGKNTQAMQDFVDGYLKIMAELESKPEVAAEGREASIAYASSGYTDLESAAKAQESYEVSSENDKSALESLSSLGKPDEEAVEISDKLSDGVTKVDEGNTMFAEGLAKAPSQTVEERAATSADISLAMAAYAEGMGMIVSSLEDLVGYIEDNSLEGTEQAKEWYEKIKSELDMVEQYSK